MNLLYVFAERHPQDLRALVRSSIPDDAFTVQTLSYDEDVESQREKMAWAEGVLYAPGRYLADDVLLAGRGVRLHQLWSSGYDKFNLAAATRAGVPVANNGGANRIAVAEHTLLLMLAVYKKLPDSYRRTITGQWSGNSHGMDMFILYRKTLGLIGLGAIGREVAVRAKAFGMRILYNDIRRLAVEEEEQLGVEFVDLDTLYRTSDIISPHLHYTADTENMIGDAEIAVMQPGAVVINVSRGELVDTDALLAALNDGRLGGAGFDVYREEPTRPGDPLVNHPNVVGTPHMACTYDTHVMALDASIDNLLRVKRGERPKFVVNPEVFQERPAA